MISSSRPDIVNDPARARLILAALPRNDCFRIDMETLARPDIDLSRLAYAYWQGNQRTRPCGLLAISHDHARLPTERWRSDHPTVGRRVDSVLNTAFVLAADRLGFTRETGRLLRQRLLEFGIVRDQRSYVRKRNSALKTVYQMRAAEVIGRALAHTLDPKLPGIHWTHYPRKASTAQTSYRRRREALAGDPLVFIDMEPGDQTLLDAWTTNRAQALGAILHETVG